MPSESVHYLRGVGLAAVGSLLWLFYFDLKDRLRPEPRRRLAFTFLLGVLSTFLAVGAFHFLPDLGLADVELDEVTWASFWHCLAVIGPVEEGAKFLLMLAVVYRWKEFDEPVDGVIYASVLALGFAAAENALYAPKITLPEQVARSLASPLTHALFASIWGFGMARARLSTRAPHARWLWIVLTLVASMALHGIYDFAILALNATLIASALVLVLWMAMLYAIRRAVAAADTADTRQAA